MTLEMKIIISHDVDHLYPSDHLFRDLVFPKLWLRSILQLIIGKISLATCYNRLILIFEHRLNRIPEIVEFDKINNIPSTFFFGMENVLGMSYTKCKVDYWIKMVLENGFDCGVHGAEIENEDKMKQEFNDFKAISNLDTFGIRTHYVRYNNNTFHKMAVVGYIFDTSEFNKKEITLKSPYKIGPMWEFPLIIMDGYLLRRDLETSKKLIISALAESKNKKLKYFTLLFHDYLFNDKSYFKEKSFYVWFVDYCKNQYLEFVSYRQAINDLESNI